MLDKVRSKYVIGKIFDKIKNKRKLNILKYNKRILYRLNINKEDFEIYKTLKEFNNKYKTNIEDIDIKELKITCEFIKNDVLRDLVKINLKEFRELDLICINISDINILERANFTKLNTLNLNRNKISDINILEKVNLKELKELDLSYNLINEEENNSILINLKSKMNIIISN